MKTIFVRLIAALAAPLVLAGPAMADTDPYDPAYAGEEGPPALILYSGVNFTGEAREVYDPVYALPDLAFNDRARSVAVLSGQWEVCEHSDFTGRCVFLRYDVPDLGWYGLSREISSARPVMEYTEAEHGLMFERDDYGYIRYVDNQRYGYDTYRYGYGVSTGVQVYHYGYSPDYVRYGYYDPRLGYDPYGFGWGGGIGTYYGSTYYHRERPPLRGHYGARDAAATLYVDSNERGPSFGINRGIKDLSRYRFNDNISSIQIRSGKWEVCEHANYQGRCQVIDASVDRLNGLRLNDNISSIRPVGGTGHDRWDRRDGGRRDGNWQGRGDGPRAGRPPGVGGTRNGSDGRDGRPRGDRPAALAGAPSVAPATVAPTPPPPRAMNRTLPGTPAMRARAQREGRDPRDIGQRPSTRSAAPARTPPARVRAPVQTRTPQAVTPPQRAAQPVTRPVTRAPEARRSVPPSMRRIEREQRQARPAATPPPRRAMPAAQPARIPTPQAARPAAPVRSFTPPTPAARPAPAPRPAVRSAPAPPQRAAPQRDTRPPAMRSRGRPTRTQD